MNSFISQVTPQTAGIVWLRPQAVKTTHPHYQALDYLLDGLLTATASSEMDSPSKVIVGQNFNRPLTVFLISPETKAAELESFFTLIKRDLKTDDRILVIDDAQAFEKLKSKIPKDIISHFHS